MASGVTLHGYRYSVYTRIVRMALHLKGVDYTGIEVDPFNGLDPDYLTLHPFGRVPVLTHDGFSLYETRAITGYIDAAFSGAPLRPATAQSRARMEQVIGIIDAYGYVPMVRQVFSHAVFRPLEGAAADPGQIAAGLIAARPVLAELERMAAERVVLDGRVTLADCHLAPMIDYFTRAPGGAAALAEYPALAAWWAGVAAWPALRATDPDLAQLGRQDPPAGRA